MRKIETFGHITDDGILKISYRAKFDQQVKLLTGQRIKLTIERLYKKRSTIGLNDNGELTRLQNGYYFGVIVNEYRNGAWEMQQRNLGIKDAHEELKANCNFCDQFNEKSGEVMRTIQTTSDMTTVQFEEYLTRCRAFILEWFGIDCPLPGTKTDLDFDKYQRES